MDIRARIDEIVNRVKSDPDIAAKFQKDPIKTVEGIIGVDLPDDVIKQIVDGVKTKGNTAQLTVGTFAARLFASFSSSCTTFA